MQSRFSWATRGQTTGPNPRCDIDLLPGHPFAVVPSLGSLFPGWVLAIPRKPVLSIRDLQSAERRELLAFSRGVAHMLSSFDPRVHYFEHGPSEQKSVVGCGVDQAHLHVVPTPLDLLGVVLADPAVNWSEASDIDPWAAIPAGVEYYLIATSTGSYVGEPNKAESQYFRKKLAAMSGAPSEWNYREWPHYEHIGRTIDHFALEHTKQAA